MVRVLITKGWLPIQWTTRQCHLARDGCRLLIPRRALLEGDLVLDILGSAGVLPLAFAEALEIIANRDMHEISASQHPGGKKP